MKKLVLILTLLITLVLAGFLYATHTKPDEPETARVSYMHMDCIPDPMPNIVIDPMVGMPMF